MIPVAVQSIIIIELDQNLDVLIREDVFIRESIPGSFENGGSFTYESIAALPGPIIIQDVPRAIQLNVIGVNRFDEPIINVYLITFTNDCGSYPALVNGQSAGWTVFVS